MQISKDKMVSLTYELRLDSNEGDVFETAGTESPLIYLQSAGMMLPAFEAAVEGLNIGESYVAEIKSADAYGEVDPEAIVELPKSIFEVDGVVNEEMLTVGNTVPMMGADGQRMNGVVLELTDEVVKMDFNHILAGQDLFFKGEIIDVREATPEELDAAYNPQQGGGCSSGGCSSGSCGDGGCGDSDGCNC